MSQANSPSFNSWVILSLSIYIVHSCSCQLFSSSFLSLSVSISLTLSSVQTALAPNCIDKYLPVLFEGSQLKMICWSQYIEIAACTRNCTASIFFNHSSPFPCWMCAWVIQSCVPWDFSFLSISSELLSGLEQVTESFVLLPFFSFWQNENHLCVTRSLTFDFGEWWDINCKTIWKKF